MVSELFVTERAVTNTNHITKKQEIFESEEVVINDSNIIDDSMEVVIDSSNIDESMNLHETTTNDSTTHSRWKIKVTKTTNNRARFHVQVCRSINLLCWRF